MNPYVGHESQLYGMEEHRLVGGKGDGMRLLEVNNGRGLEAVISLDRNADIARLRYRGMNLAFFSPCGYVAPAYYESTGTDFLKSFTAGFLTTCGLGAVGSPCRDEGEELPLHGTIANTPTDWHCCEEEGGRLVVRARTMDQVIFARKFVFRRRIEFPLDADEFTLTDTIVNEGDRVEPLMLLYHMNMGYPLLDENSVVTIPSEKVEPRDAHAAEDLAHWMTMQKPTPGYVERCYYHTMKKRGFASIYQPARKVGLAIEYDADSLDCFTEWKMMGVRDYVLGLECGNCYPDGRDVMREKGLLKFLAPGEEKTYSVKVRIFTE